MVVRMLIMGCMKKIKWICLKTLNHLISLFKTHHIFPKLHLLPYVATHRRHYSHSLPSRRRHDQQRLRPPTSRHYQHHFSSSSGHQHRNTDTNFGHRHRTTTTYGSTDNYSAFLVHQRHLLSLFHFKLLKPSLILFLIVVY